MKHNLKINDLILITIKRLGINGEGIGYYKRLAVFVDGAIPDEVVEVKITEVKAKYAYGEIVKIKSKSPDRVLVKSRELLNLNYNLQHIKYEKQLELKRNSLVDSLTRYFSNDISKINIKEMIGMKNPWGYQNTVFYPVRHDGLKIVVGIQEKVTNRLIYLDKYLLENKLIEKAIKDILNFLTESEVNVYHPKHTKGNLKYMFLRGFPGTNEVQVTFVLLEEDRRILNIFKDLIKLENIVSVNYVIDDGDEVFSLENKEIINLVGNKTIKYEFGHLKFNLNSNQNINTNTEQILNINNELINLAKFNKNHKVVNLFSRGPITSLFISKYVDEVRAIDNNDLDLNPFEDFKKDNDINNLSFYSGRQVELLLNFKKEGYHPDYIILEPDHRGASLDLLKFLQRSNVKKIIYISTNHSTLAKDLSHLQSAYKLMEIVPVDLYPFRPYIASVSLLIKK